jgi:hypothetical protein
MMNEHDLREAFRSAIAVSEPPPPMSAAAATRAGRNRLRRRNTLVGLGGAMSAVVVAAAVLALPGPWAATPPPEGDGRPDPSSSVAPDAQRIVRDAARSLRQRTDPVPRPDQFVYRKTVDSFGYPPKLREIWLSVDGTADGLLKERAQNPTDPQTGPHITPDAMLPGCRHGQIGIELENNRPTQYVPCTPRPTYRSDLPTDGTEMLDYLNARMDKENPTERSRKLDPLRDLFNSSYVPASAAAALFEAAAQIPELYVRAGVVDGTGRAAVAIGVHSTETFRNELLFDAATYQYIGERAVETATVNAMTTESTTAYSMVLAQGFVDRTGQLP